MSVIKNHKKKIILKFEYVGASFEISSTLISQFLRSEIVGIIINRVIIGRHETILASTGSTPGLHTCGKLYNCEIDFFISNFFGGHSLTDISN